MKKSFHKLSIILFHIVVQFIYLFTLYIYSFDLKWVPWYEIDNYRIYLLIFYLPILFLFAYFIRFMVIRETPSVINLQFTYPVFFAIVTFLLPFTGLLGPLFGYVGFWSSLVLWILSWRLIVLDFKGVAATA
ncbi:hypothetical protein QWJ34_20870 [Saccharibacillus sp. CPCC 101409]|uniref:hypothetical protein n=1 Tax=Saccharibacillus sp. CPCC 101409 TaxID=3058041 RepID=UPI0026726665|nr:hypothetical protein [Saccharibacillus sp. CPCC 101409]MDO3412229.1 hypothetical protein [Saccharibacillus sp. CPCC 101409]